MRRGELLGLRWRDVDLDRAELHVRQQRSRQHGELRFGPPKTRAGPRTIDLDAGTVAVLCRHREAQEIQRRSWGKEYRVDLDLVFGGDQGQPQDPDTVRRRFDREVRLLHGKVGLRVIRFHDLRHTHATLLLEDGLDAKYVSERQGHDSVQTTLELYGHVTSKRRSDAARRIGAMLDDVPGRIGDPVVTPHESVRCRAGGLAVARG